MQMEIEAAGDRLTARIKGELDHHSAAQARAQLDALLTDERIRELRIDLRGLTFMDSSGLGVILGRYRVIAGRGLLGLSFEMRRQEYNAGFRQRSVFAAVWAAAAA